MKNYPQENAIKTFWWLGMTQIYPIFRKKAMSFDYRNPPKYFLRNELLPHQNIRMDVIGLLDLDFCC